MNKVKPILLISMSTRVKELGFHCKENEDERKRIGEEGKWSKSVFWHRWHNFDLLEKVLEWNFFLFF